MTAGTILTVVGITGFIFIICLLMATWMYKFSAKDQ